MKINEWERYLIWPTKNEKEAKNEQDWMITNYRWNTICMKPEQEWKKKQSVCKWESVHTQARMREERWLKGVENETSTNKQERERKDQWSCLGKKPRMNKNLN